MEVPRQHLDLRDDPFVLSPPQIARTYGCASVVNITAYAPQATLDVEVDGVVVVSGFPGGSPAPFGALIPLSTPLTPGQVVRARQKRLLATSPWSAPSTVIDHTIEYPAGPPRPEIFATPLYKCGARTGLANLLVGSFVRISADGATVGSVVNANNPQGVDISPAFDAGQKVRAFADLCGDPSPPSLEQTVQPPPLPLHAPDFEPIFQGATAIVIKGIVNGARLTPSRNGVAIGSFPCWGGSCKIDVAPVGLSDSFSATQELCRSDGPSPPGTATVQPCSALPAPQVGPVQAGDTTVVVTQFVPGSEIKVFVNNLKTGDGSGPVVPLTQPIPHGATVHVWQIAGSCHGRTVQQVDTHCVAPPVWGDPSAPNLFPVGTTEYDGGDVKIDGFTYRVHGSIYYPAEDDGEAQAFNQRLAALGRVPVVVCVHGAHSANPESYLGYDYFQYQLAQMGFVAVSVDERQTDLHNDWAGGPQNIVRRALLAIASIAHLQQLDAAGPTFQGRIDFGRTGLMGHSRGGDCVIAIPERIALPGVTINAVLSLAPTSFGAHNGQPAGYPFMTLLPAADGDVVRNNGAKFYDRAVPGPFKTQLYIDHANHNFFNRKWTNDDAGGQMPIMSRPDHERFLSTYGCAFFRFALRGDPTFGYLEQRVLPAGVLNQHNHVSYDVRDARVVNNYDGHSITINTEGENPTQLGGLVADVFRFRQAAGAFNTSFFGDTEGNVSQCRNQQGQFREPLRTPADLTTAEIRVRAAEVFEGTIPAQPTGFRVGVEDEAGVIAWVDVDSVGGLPRPFDRSGFDARTKTMLSTFRFPGSCFLAVASQLRLQAIRAIHLGLDRGDGRPIAFDDVEIVG